MAGLGIGFLSLNTISLERRLDLVRVPSMTGLPVVRRWHVVHRRGKQLLPLAQAFRDFVRDHGAEYANASAAAPAEAGETKRGVRPKRPAANGRRAESRGSTLRQR
jgi:hypothetical protein